MDDTLPCVCAESSGVPILLCPTEFAEYWEGINEPRNGRIIKAEFGLNRPNGVHVDYDRACDAASDYVNTIQIGPGNALIFGEEIPYMFWIISETFDGGYFTTNFCSLDEEGLQTIDLIKSLPNDFFSDTGCSVTCSNKGLVLFPSTQAPIDGEYFEFVEIQLPTGEYAATLGFYETRDTNIRIIKIQRQDL